MSRFVVPKRKAGPVVPETDRVTVTQRTVTLTCGCRTRKPPAVTRPGGINEHWCDLHRGFKRERR